MNTEIKNIIKATSDESQYDQKAKKILGNKHILTQIICASVDEFKGMNPKEVFQHIEGEPLIQKVPVDPGMTNKKEENISGFNTEDSEIGEGIIKYDIILYVRTSDGLAQIIINVEAQKDEPTKYKIINRTVFYACRLISSQKNRDFVKQNFDEIKQVYSIWVCMNLNENCMDYIHLTDDKLLGHYNWKGRLDLLNIVLIGLSEKIPDANDEEYRLHRLLGTIFSARLSVDEKTKVMENEYGIPMEQDLKEDVENMCNLGEGIAEEAEAKGIIQTALSYGIPKANIINRLQEMLGLTLQQAELYFGRYSKHIV